MLLLSTMQVTVAMGAFSGGGRRILYLHANQLVPHTPCATAYSCNPYGQSLLELQANKERHFTLKEMPHPSRNLPACSSLWLRDRFSLTEHKPTFYADEGQVREGTRSRPKI